ncbi:MAG TPA: DUF1934 domain-containing protein [Candidatus Faecousia intestinigallinarum]|nr:DUF1934 domain-containing protein [Candidatus Faecousia intestinigallinarum]
MKQPVILSIRGEQNYQGQEPDTIEMVTEGVLELREDGWVIEYEESELTGLQGVTTTFCAQGDTITLTRRGALNSQMVFQPGVSHDSLYEMEYGALLITVTANRIESQITRQGGTVDLRYAIEIEQTAAGTIDYHLDVRPKEIAC